MGGVLKRLHVLPFQDSHETEPWLGLFGPSLHHLRKVGPKHAWQGGVAALMVIETPIEKGIFVDALRQVIHNHKPDHLFSALVRDESGQPLVGSKFDDGDRLTVMRVAAEQRGCVGLRRRWLACLQTYAREMSANLRTAQPSHAS